MVIFFMQLEMFGQIFDPLSQDSDLHMGRSGIIAIALEFIDQRLLLFTRNAHAFLLPFFLGLF